MPMFLYFILAGSILFGFGVSRWWFVESKIKIPKEKRGGRNRQFYLNGELLWISIKETLRGERQ